MKAKILSCLTLVVVLSMITSTAFAVPAPPTPQAGPAAPNAALGNLFQTADAAGPALYIVQLQDPALASYTGGLPDLAPTSPRATGADKLDPNAPASKDYLSYLKDRQQIARNSMEKLLGRSLDVTFEYLAVLNGFAATMSPDEAAAIAKLPGVKAVYRDVEREMDTDVGPIHIGANAIWNGNTGTGLATRGEGVIIGMIDSGINHAHPSFAATDGGGYTHTNPYGAGVYKGWCVANPSFCNSKLIAAYGLNPVGGDPEDADGHGSHTASTAGGNAHTASFNIGPTPYNIPIQGVAPRANIVAYKVCNPSCPGTASVAAVNSAILNDQVDVINYSISGSDSPWTDPVDIAFLDAYNAGIFVSASAGNNGPGASTVAKTGPWNAAVAASTINRVIANTLDVTGPTTPPALQGMPAVPGELTSIVTDVTGPIRFNAANSNGCSAFSSGYFTGALALIQRGSCDFSVKVNNAATAGAIGVIVFNSVGGPPISMGALTGTPPAFMLDLANGIALRDYVVANPTATVRVNAATSYLINNAWQDIVGGFSSRGPSQFELVKPDYIAPGVNTLAAVAAGATPATYAFYQGTSMSSPHGAGAAALMVALYPSWSPAEIKSAMASTATGGLVKEDGVTPADPFDVGSGLLNLAGASRAGLVLDETYARYVAANPATGGDPKTLNQPSMANYNCATSCSWTRTVKAVKASTWTASSSAPAGMTLTVTPSSFTLAAGATQVITIQANVSGLPMAQWAFGSVTLTPANQTITATKLPVVVKPTANVPDINVTPASLAATQATNTTTSQTLTIGNIGTAPLTWQIAEAPVSMRVTLTPDSPDAPNAPISLVVDDGVGENAIGLNNGGQFLWLNRFTPSAGNFPIQLDQVDVMFGYPAGGAGGVNVGELVDIYLYEDADGNPANGATFKGSLLNQAVEAVSGTTWSTFPLAAPVSFTGPGDILIAVVNRTAGVAAGTFPAALDQTGSQVRSWIGLGTGATTNPPTLPPATFGTADSFGFPGNWLVRGFGQGAAACDNPADVPWLTVAPTGGTTAAGSSTPVAIGFNSTALAVGTYNAVLCVTSNDPTTPLVEVPVSLTVEDQPGDLVRICSQPNVAIPDGSPTGVSDTINVPADLTILDFNVYIKAAHTWSGDATFTFQHVNTATSVTLIDRPGVPASTYGCSGDNYDVTVDDEGTDTPIETQCNATAPAISGRAPGGDPVNTSLLTAFDGQSTLGAWTLTAIDNAAGDTGTLQEWCVEVTVPTAGPPNINVDPLSLASTQAPDTTTQQTLNVGNTGGSDLTWSIYEDATAAPLVDWSDNFDSYATGSQLHGQGGWKGWGNSAASGALTSSDQAHSAPNSAAILGASDLVHEYTATDGQWTYTAWQFIPTDFTGQSYLILLNSYDDAGSNTNWSAQVMFDATANTVTNDGGVSGGSLPLVKGQWVPLRVEIDLNADTGAFYYNNQLLYSGTWSGQVSGSGATSIAAVDLFANNASVIYYDDMSLTQAAAACDAPSDISWASLAPANGVTTPGGSSPVQVTFNSAGLAVGSYSGNLCVASNDPDAGPGNGTNLVVVPLTLNVETVTPVPNINVSPLSLAATQAANTTTSQTLNVGNTGTATLNWTIAEEPIATAPAAVAPNPNADPAQAREVVNPAEGAAPDGTAPAPRSDWRWPTVVLYDNGPLVTHPGGGAGGADASALQQALGLSTYGFGHAITSGYRMADDFTVPAGGWMIDTITFFAYQTGSTTASTINAVNLRIWDGVPDAAGSSVVWGDTTTNRLASSTWTNSYRVLDTALTGSTRPIMANVATVGIFLPAGVYWVDWQTGGTLTSGPWAPPVSILGQTTKPGANAVQFDPTAAVWNPALDTGTAQTVQDLPFIIQGTTSAPICSLPSDVSWLSEAPTNGSTAAGGTTPVQVTFDSTGLAVGTYTANLCVTSDDPDAGPGNGTNLVVVPVSLTVEEAPPGEFACNAPPEGFETGVPPAGWSVQTAEPDGPQWTTIAGSGETGNYTNGTGEAATASSDGVGTAEFDTSLVTPAFDLSGASAASLGYTANYQNFANLDFLDVDISTDGGATWANLLRWNEDHGTFGAPPGVNVSIDLAAYAGQSGLKLRWRYYDPNTSDWDWYAQIDNVALGCTLGQPPNIVVDPLSLAATQPPDTTTSQPLTIANTGEGDLVWNIAEEPATVLAPMNDRLMKQQIAAAAADLRVPEGAATGSRTGVSDATAPVAFTAPADFSEGFDDITLLPGQGWFTQNNSSPLGSSDWFQGNTSVFDAQAGAPTAYIGANFNNTSGAGTISNWLLTPELTLVNGDTISFWTRVPTDGGIYPDRLELRLSTAGSSTNVGTLATDVGDFTTLLLAVNPDLTTTGYPEVWTQYSATLSGIPAGATGRIAFRYFVTDGGPSGNNSNYIGIDTVAYTSAGPAGPCSAPADVPWLSEAPTSGTTAGGGVTPVTVSFNSTGLAAGTYTANLCITSNDPDAGPGNETELVIVPVTLTVEEGQQAMIAGFVFLDVNENGWRNAEEQAGLAGVTVTLSKDGVPIATYWSNAPTGWYHFLNYGAGNYCVEYPVPAGYVPTSPTKVCFTYDGKTKIVNFGVIPARANIGDQVFFDANSNGVFDAGDYGIGNVTVALWTASGGTPGAVIATTTTAADGTYLFANIVPGAYFVQVTDTHGELTGLSLTTAGNPLGPITVVHLQSYLDADFGYNLVCSSTRGAISGRVWNDANGDQVQDAGEAGIAGVQACAEPLSYLATRCRTTNSAGYFYMCVPKGTYLVAPLTDVAPLAEMTPTTPEFYLPVVIRPGGSFLTAFFGYK